MNTINLENNTVYKTFDLIREGEINDVIKYINEQDFISNPINRFQWIVVGLINERLEKQGLSLENIRSE